MNKKYTFTPSQLKAFLQDYACIDPNAVTIEVTWFHYPARRQNLTVVTYHIDARLRPDGQLQPKSDDVAKYFPFTKQFGYYRKTGFNPYGVCAKIVNASEVNVELSTYISNYSHKRRVIINIDYFDYKD